MARGDNEEPSKKKFYDEIVQAQKFVAGRKWKDLKEIFMNDKTLVMEDFNANGSTVLHVVAREGQVDILTELMEMLTADGEKEEVLKKGNRRGNTILHEVAASQVDQHVTRSTLNVVRHQAGDKLIPVLLKLKNEDDETPVFRAAKYGNLTMLKYIHANFSVWLNPTDHFPPSRPLNGNGTCRPILHCCSLNLKFETAVWLVENVERLDMLTMQKSREKISKEKEFEELTCLEQLSRMPLAFSSTATQEMGITSKIIYYILPNKGHDDERNQPATNETPRRQLTSSFWSFMTFIYYAFWKLLVKGLPCTCIDEIWEQKKNHIFAKRLVHLLVRREDSWKMCVSKSSGLLVVSPKFPSNVTERKKQIELNDRLKIKIDLKDQLKKEKGKETDVPLKDQVKKENEIEIEIEIEESKDDGTSSKEKEKEGGSPLLDAAAFGIIEVVKMMVDDYPESMSHVDDHGYNIVHIAVKHRQLEIYRFIEQKPAFKSLVRHITREDGRTVLHQAATMQYFREQQLPGVAYQLQHELQWYHRVSLQVPRPFIMHVDEEGLTARDLLEIEHVEMHDQAKQWMKETAQSCSTVAVLIAGVVFAAAYAIPGGFDKGKPTLLKKSTFRIFTVMDVVALSCSLGSVVLFLAILTSSFDLNEFRKSLIRKLTFGFIFLFLALVTTMLAFAATILLTIRLESNKKTTIFAYSLAFIFVSLFGLTQFPWHRMIAPPITRCWRYYKKIMPVSA